jgi:uncharacterized delta-60 repeat protein
MVHAGLLIGCLSMVVAAGVVAAPLELDPTFDGDGRRVVIIFSAFPEGPAPGIAVTSDDKIVTVGRYSGPFRFETGGALDATFGTGGVASGGVIDARAMALQPDDSVLVVHGGSVVDGMGTTHVIDVTRWDSNGVVDGTFGTGGTTRINLSPLDAYGEAVLVQGDGKILIAGWVGFPEDLLMVRLDSLGALDPTFGDFGTDEGLLDVLLLPDGRIIGVGAYDQSFLDASISPAVGTSADFLAVRFLDDGSVDGTFGTGGATVIPGGLSGAMVVARQSDGKLVLGGGGSTQRLDRLDPDGALDGTFGTGGTALATNGGRAAGLAVNPDGSIVSVSVNFTILRYFSDGSIDPTVGPCVSLETDFPGFIARAASLTRMSDGRIVVGGGDDNHVAVARYDDGTERICAEPLKSKFKYKHFAAGNLVLYQWKTKDPLSPIDFGDPTASTDYSLCIIDYSSGQPVLQQTLTFFGGQICDGSPCWSQTGSGFKYKRRVTGPFPSSLDKSAVRLKAGTKGGNLKVKSLRAGNSFNNYVGWGPITARLYRSDASGCWETTFPDPGHGNGVRAKYP